MNAEPGPAFLQATSTCTTTTYRYTPHIICILFISPPPSQASVLRRIREVTARHAWHHRTILPRAAVDRSFAIMGDASRLKEVALKLVLGG